MELSNTDRYGYTFSFLHNLPGEDGTGRLSRKFIRNTLWLPARATLRGIFADGRMFPWEYAEPWRCEEVVFMMNHGAIWMSRSWSLEELHHFDIECLVHRDKVMMLRFASRKYKNRLTWVLPDEDDPYELDHFVRYRKPHRYAHLITADPRLHKHPVHGGKVTVLQERFEQGLLSFAKPHETTEKTPPLRLVKA